MSDECYVLTRKAPGGDFYPVRAFRNQEDARFYKQALEKLAVSDVYQINKVDLS